MSALKNSYYPYFGNVQRWKPNPTSYSCTWIVKCWLRYSWQSNNIFFHPNNINCRITGHFVIDLRYLSCKYYYLRLCVTRYFLLAVNEFRQSTVHDEPSSGWKWNYTKLWICLRSWSADLGTITMLLFAVTLNVAKPERNQTLVKNKSRTRIEMFHYFQTLYAHSHIIT
jgi:GR25 family glycosyltransferase involved in LPS biosynthesis